MIDKTNAAFETQLKNAEKSFWTGRYIESVQSYETIYSTAEDQETRLRALYGLACGKLVLASDPAEYAKAKQLWDKWAMETSIWSKKNNPMMLSLALLRPSWKKPRTQECPPPPKPDLSWQKQLQEKEKEINTLRKQIKDIESLHRQMQEKKKGFGSF